ncbi:Protein shisa-6 [Liparis tanakae]|uniref:Protein shisa-6 n=1 Tax=Liparis tanakae TaxID=230148 RepID=A0A4Z2FXJ8_9TELE|nr:Protein shisa-6 [Liparis tanakae]
MASNASINVPRARRRPQRRTGRYFVEISLPHGSGALADILRQQGPVPISQYEHENLGAIDGSPKDETPVRTLKNHYTPVHAKASNHDNSVARSPDPASGDQL